MGERISGHLLRVSSLEFKFRFKFTSSHITHIHTDRQGGGVKSMIGEEVKNYYKHEGYVIFNSYVISMTFHNVFYISSNNNVSRWHNSEGLVRNSDDLRYVANNISFEHSSINRPSCKLIGQGRWDHKLRSGNRCEGVF